MSSYVIRTTTPATTDPNFINYAYGGNNRCIAIDNTGYVLPNCTGYCWGRWLELGVVNVALSTGNATNWYGNTGDGYQRGQTPRQGAVACWSGGSGGEGHVAIVEEIATTGVTVTESAYNSYAFRTNTYPLNMAKSGYTFQGYIYIPLTFDDLFIFRRHKRIKVRR